MRPFLFCAALALLVYVPASAAIPDRERSALLSVYNTMNGPNWTYRNGWGGPPGTECDWAAVTCDDARTTVTQLVLGYNNLSGPIPAAIGDLTNLETLNFSSDAVTGTIPAAIGMLSKLKVLQLDQNDLTGSISPLGALTSLTDLELEVNNLSGSIPAEIGRLTKLRQLRLDVNQFTGSIPREIGQLTALQMLQLDDNKLGGPIPAEIGNLTQLTLFSFSSNSLSGPLPVEIAQLRNLQTLAGYNNRLTGPIPAQIGSLSQLTELTLWSNQLSGDVPPSLFGMATLRNIGLARNQLTGSIGGFANLPQLVELHLDGNQFTGPIPPQITSLTKLEVLVLAGNQLTGPIPSDIDRLRSLRVLDVGTNHIGGTIPTALANLPALEFLGLYEDELTGTLPPALGSLSNLKELYVYTNQIAGSIPDSYRNLTNIDEFNFSNNRLSGTLPEWLATLPKLSAFIVNTNAFTGAIPESLMAAPALDTLDLGSNQLTGSIPPDIGRLQTLEYLTLSDNELTGPIPDSIWDLKNLKVLQLAGLHLTGTLSRRVASLTLLNNLDVQDNELTGTIPPEVASLRELLYLDLGSNRFTGTLRREFGQMKKLQSIDFSANNFRSPVPTELLSMTGLIDGAVDFSYNAFSESDPVLVAFMNRKQFDHDFAHSQTVTPAGVTVSQMTDRSAVVAWTPIQYQYDEGGYQVIAALAPGGSAAAIATTSSKEASSITVRGLQPATTYYFRVFAVTHPHDFQRNLVVSDASAEVSAPTGPRTLAPPDVVLTSTPAGLVQLDGVAQNDDSFTLTNFGDIATAITLDKFDFDFYNVTPESFTLAGGASQTVRITSIPNQPAGVRYGGVVPRGTGTTDDDIVTITLLSATKSGGGAVAEAVTSRVEVVGTVGSDSIGTVTFRNRGTSPLTGILVADVPWIVPDSSPITIDPGSSALVRFTVKRSRRPADQLSGALTGTLSLVYVSQLRSGSNVVGINDTTPSGISITKVTVVDSTKPDVGPANAPQIAAGEIAFFIAGLTASNSASSSLASDLHIFNTSGSKPVNDLRLYYASSTLKAVANLSALGSSQAVTLANVVPNVYSISDQTGSMQVRSDQWRSLSVNAVLLRLVNGVGTYFGDLPVFRSDRTLRANDTAYLTGVAQSGTVHAVLYLEEAGGSAESVTIHPLDATGNSLGDRTIALPPSSTAQVSDLPAAAITIAVDNRTTATPNGVIAYVRMTDDATGDSWSVIDWSRFYDFKRNAPVRVPLVVSGGGGSKRRAVKHSASHESEAVTPRTTTSVSIFNSSTTGDARAKLTAGGVSKDVTIAKGQTLTIADVASFAGAPAGAQSLVIEPLRGEIVATSRLSTGPSIGTSVPVVESASGLRVGQGQTFFGLEDSTSATVNASTPGTYRTDYGFVETGGAATTVRATIAIAGVRTTATATRDFRLEAGGFILVKDLVRSIVGDSRDTQFRDLHDLKLQIDVVDGSGAILPFVIVTDNGSGDISLRLQ